MLAITLGAAFMLFFALHVNQTQPQETELRFNQ